MVPRYRRTILGFLAASVASLLSGCNIDVSIDRGDDNGEPSPRLRVYPDREQTEDGWEMSARVRNMTDWHASIHDVTVVAFDEHGEEICRVEMGDFPQGEKFEETETVDCTAFPAIVTAIAKESPCDGAQIRMLYYTSEKDPTTVEDLNHHSFWEGRWRECDEELPPEHVIKEVRQSGAGTNKE